MRVFYLLIFVFLIQRMTSQSLYIEVLGKGFVNSINFEYPLQKNTFGWNLQAGVGFAPTSLISVPVTISHVLGQKNHHLELGVGATYLRGYLWVDDDSFGPDILAHAVAYYRYQKPEGGVIFKIGATPFIDNGPQVGLWFGAGIGYAFKK